MVWQVGELDQRVGIYRPVSTPDGMGGNTVVNTLQSIRWCHVRPNSGGEVTDYDRVNANARYLFVFRYFATLQNGDLLSWDGEFYNIRVIKKPKSRRLYIEVEAERGVAM